MFIGRYGACFMRPFLKVFLIVSLICWHSRLCDKDEISLNNIAQVCSKIIGVQEEDSSYLWDKRVIKKAKAIMNQHDHILPHEFVLMPSGCPLKALPNQSLVYIILFAIKLSNLDTTL